MKREVARGALWMLAESGSWEGLAFIVFLFMARLLTPADYGIASIAAAIVMFAQAAVTRGLADAIVAQSNLDEDVISTAFWTTLLIAGILFVILAIAAGPIAWAYGEPLLAPVLRWFLACLITSALVGIPLAVLRRQLRFSAFALRSAGGGIIGGLVGISMAISGCGVWSLVGNQVAQGIAAVVLVWSTSEWRPRLKFSLSALRRLSGFSAQAVLGAELDILSLKIDLLIVGLSFDTVSVGYYYIVKRILQTASGVAIYPVWSVSLPALGRLAADKVRFNKGYISLISAAQVLWLPLVLGFGLTAGELVPVLLGAHWVAAVPVAEAASPLCLSYAIVLCTGQALCAAGRADLYARLGLFQLFVMVLLFAAASRFDIIAASFALSASFAAVVPAQLWTLRRTTGLAYRDFSVPYVRLAGAGGLMAAAILVTRAASAAMPASFRLALEVVLGAVTYLGGLWMMARPISLELITMAQAALTRRGLAGNEDVGQ